MSNWSKQKTIPLVQFSSGYYRVLMTTEGRKMPKTYNEARIQFLQEVFQASMVRKQIEGPGIIFYNSVFKRSSLAKQWEELYGSQTDREGTVDDPD